MCSSAERGTRKAAGAGRESPSRFNAELTDVTADEGLGARGSETLPRRASFARERSRLEPAEAEVL